MNGRFFLTGKKIYDAIQRCSDLAGCAALLQVTVGELCKYLLEVDAPFQYLITVKETEAGEIFSTHYFKPPRTPAQLQIERDFEALKSNLELKFAFDKYNMHLDSANPKSSIDILNKNTALVRKYQEDLKELIDAFNIRMAMNENDSPSEEYKQDTAAKSHLSQDRVVDPVPMDESKFDVDQFFNFNESNCSLTDHCTFFSTPMDNKAAQLGTLVQTAKTFERPAS